MRLPDCQVAALHQALQSDESSLATWRWYSDLVDNQRLALRLKGDQWVVTIDGSDFACAESLAAALRWTHIMTHSGGYITFAA
ncbi:hypothetical protein WCQ02_35080 [Paraburkholderia tropica]|uniref:Uncharacterized protein n=1 Tax=Paraburkholderia tropica TaxID=92647 RepID=A0ABX5ME88_9BURK|nr:MULTISPECIES: hypothetical protein [Paraburkholderia]PXX02563.1 hypothetical protein C7400_15311 [Paraburkholderia tropica]PZW69171.1 hypothetical protein C7399_15311 [Paraburkholderia tropica]RQM44198.1 hypothetical protein EHZ19_29975 [Paraburkholderia bannensis]